MGNSFQLKKSIDQESFAVWEATFDNFTGQLECSLSGIEFLLSPDRVHEITKDGETYKPLPSGVLIFNGFRGHLEKYQETSAQVKSVVIKQRYLEELCEPLKIKPQEIDFQNEGSSSRGYLADQLKFLVELSEAPIDSSGFSLDCITSEVILTALTSDKHSMSAKVEEGERLGYFPDTISRVKTIIRKNLENPHFDLDLLAKESGVSKFHMIRAFKDNVGISPAKYLNQLKIDICKQWLTQTKKSILSIAMDLGFSDLSTFNKAFKRATGTTPTSFRHQYTR